MGAVPEQGGDGLVIGFAGDVADFTFEVVGQRVPSFRLTMC